MTDEELIVFRDSVHLPEDVPEELVPDILEILNRIPKGWGRWLSLDSGWYPLIVDLHRKLAALDPGYEVHQVKEKFGSLRYYFGMSPFPEFPCCTAWDAENQIMPRTSWKADDPKGEDYDRGFRAWATAFDAHVQTQEHQAAVTEREPLNQARNELFRQMLALADAAEELSMVTCELCGSPGKLSSRNNWLKTVCQSCALEHRYEEIEVNNGPIPIDPQ